ncbi:MAG: tetratricopeptide repeat protein, partial [Bryobacteraceae bacterium]
LAEALAAFGRALSLDPGSAAALNNRGLALLMLGQRDAAAGDFRAALRLNPCLFDAHRNLGRLQIRTEPPGDCRFTPEQRAALAETR